MFVQIVIDSMIVSLLFMQLLLSEQSKAVSIQPALSMLCQFSMQIKQLHRPIEHPLPSDVVFVHNEKSSKSPFLSWLTANKSSGCPFIKVLSISSEVHLNHFQVHSLIRSKFLLLECSEEAKLGFRQCFRFLQRISELSLVDKLVARRIFAMLLVYEEKPKTDRSISTQLKNALLQLSKTHALIISFTKLGQENEIAFDHMTFVRPLRNVCTVERNIFTFTELSVSLLFRWLLARDVYSKVIDCDFNNSKLNAVVTQVSTIINI